VMPTLCLRDVMPVMRCSFAANHNPTVDMVIKGRHN
jgi:hypothetical protein